MATNFAALQELLKQKKASLKVAGKTIKPKGGVNRYVILPSWRGDSDPQFWHDYGQHFVKDEAGTLQAIYICTDKTFGTPCAVCDGLAEAQRTVGAANPAVAELIKQARGNQSFLLNVLALDSDTPDVPQVLALGKNAFEQLISVMSAWGEQVLDKTAPLIVTVERTGTTVMDTRYTAQPSPNKHVFKKPATPINLDEFVKQESAEAERKALTAIRHVSGRTLAAPGGKDRPALAAPAKATDAEFEDVPAFAHAGTVTVAAPSAASITEDIDGLLAALDTQ